MNNIEKENILISACLLGDKCRYDGKVLSNKLNDLIKYYNLIPFCPEVSGGLSIPRDPSEIINGKVISSKGRDVTSFFNRGAFLALSICKEKKVSLAILKEESPSCGKNKIYDGSFKGVLIDGKGITTRKLLNEGIKVINEEEALLLLKEKENENN